MGMGDCGIVVATVEPSEGQSGGLADHEREAENLLEEAVGDSALAVVGSCHGLSGQGKRSAMACYGPEEETLQEVLALNSVVAMTVSPVWEGRRKSAGLDGCCCCCCCCREEGDRQSGVTRVLLKKWLLVLERSKSRLVWKSTVATG